MQKKLSADVLIKIPFFDVDMMRIAWHGHYLKYFEQARCALFDRLGYNYREMEASGYAWPVIDLRIKYIRPAEFNRTVRARAILVEWENRLGIDYLITDEESGTKLTKGRSFQVAVEIASGEMQYVSPAALLERVQCALQSS
jgi:acyl-CoA thioester hydrolase